MVLPNSTNSPIGLICTLLVWLLPSMSQAQQQWNELGPGLYYSVYEIELNGTDVYAGILYKYGILTDVMLSMI